jgi:hypothetical protein
MLKAIVMTYLNELRIRRKLQIVAPKNNRPAWSKWGASNPYFLSTCILTQILTSSRCTTTQTLLLGLKAKITMNNTGTSY